jgi:hypothetical protein
MEINLQAAKKLYPCAPVWFQEELIKEFGRGYFEKTDWHNIKTFGDACEAIGVEVNELFLLHDTRDEVAFKKLKIIICAINQGWVPDWGNGNQRKWWPWFTLSSGFGFSDSYYNYDNANTNVGFRLCFETKEKADYAAKQFLDIYKDFLL